MTRYLLDTSSLIDYAKNREPGFSAVSTLIAGSDVIGTSAVQIAELFAGLPPEDRPKWQAFLDTLAYWDITSDIAMQAGIYRYTYARQGITLSTQDTLIAAVAYAYGAIVVTGNVRGFPMPDIGLLPMSR